jgi:hypothetical protein
MLMYLGCCQDFALFLRLSLFSLCDSIIIALSSSTNSLRKHGEDIRRPLCPFLVRFLFSIPKCKWFGR